MTVGGRYRALRRCALGVLAGVGLVTGASRAAVEGGRFYPARAARWVKPSAVFYLRDRSAMGYGRGKLWRHPLTVTFYGHGPSGPVFRSAGESSAVASICPMSGAFICEG